ILDIPHGETSQNEVEYRLAWSRTYLKKYGLIENSSSGRGVWSLKSIHLDLSAFDPKEVLRVVREADRAKSANTTISSIPLPSVKPEEEEAVLAWHQQLHQVLMNLSPAAFERLTQRLLRESGFIQVEVTKQTGDGGIDGIGIARIAGFLSFHVL